MLSDVFAVCIGKLNCERLTQIVPWISSVRAPRLSSAEIIPIAIHSSLGWWEPEQALDVRQ